MALKPNVVSEQSMVPEPSVLPEPIPDADDLVIEILTDQMIDFDTGVGTRNELKLTRRDDG